MHVISGDKNEEKPGQAVKLAPARSPQSFRSYLNSTLFVGLAIIVGIVLDQTLDVQNLALVFLMAVLAAAVRGGSDRRFMPPCSAPLRSIFSFWSRVIR